MTIDKNIYTGRSVNWFKELNSKDEGRAIIKNSTLAEMLILFERTTGDSPMKK
jgi:hypothetical protein